MLDFDRVQSVLEGLDANVNAAEAHGILCALLLDDRDFPTWLGHCLDDLPDPGDVLARERLALLQELFDLTRDQLASDELGLELLLPDDDEDFAQRLLGLSSWCEGFVYGFGVLGKESEAALDPDAREGLGDLLEISRLGHDEDASDEAQQQFVEVAEHVRIVVLMLQQTLNPPNPSPTLH